MTVDPNDQNLRLLTIPQVADLLGVTRGTVYRHIADGELPVVDIGRGAAKTRVLAADLADFIDKRRRWPRGPR